MLVGGRLVIPVLILMCVVMNDEVSMENSAVHSKVNTETLDEAWLTVETQLTNESEQAVKGQ